MLTEMPPIGLTHDSASHAKNEPNASRPPILRANPTFSGGDHTPIPRPIFIELKQVVNNLECKLARPPFGFSSRDSRLEGVRAHIFIVVNYNTKITIIIIYIYKFIYIII